MRRGEKKGKQRTPRWKAGLGAISYCQFEIGRFSRELPSFCRPLDEFRGRNLLPVRVAEVRGVRASERKARIGADDDKLIFNRSSRSIGTRLKGEGEAIEELIRSTRGMKLRSASEIPQMSAN